MASNDQWPPVASPSRGKSQNKGKNNANKKKCHRQMVLDVVTEMFATTLEPEVIVSLAQNCNWDLQSTIDALIALSATVETPMDNGVKKNFETMTTMAQTEHHHQLINDELSDECLKMNPAELKEQLDGFTKFERLKRTSTKNRMGSFRGNIAKLDTPFGNAQISTKKEETVLKSVWNPASSHRGTKAKNSRSSDTSFSSNSSKQSNQNTSNNSTNVSQSSNNNEWQSINSSSTMPITPSRLNSSSYSQTTKSSSKCYSKASKLGSARQLCGLQVHYRSSGMESSSDDDDADVVIEEEFNNYGVHPESALTVSQFLSSSVQKSSPTHQIHKTKSITTASSSDTPKKINHNATLDRIIKTINNGDKILVILRGLPGAGKSTLAKKIVSMTDCKGDPSLYIFSTDDYFLQKNRGLYVYDPTKLSYAHNSNQQRVFNALKSSTSPVIVDNTNLQSWEMRPYASMAVQQGYCIEVLDVDTPWANNINELARKNKHGVMKSKIADMQMRYERGIDGKKLLKLYSLRYPEGESPRRIDKINPIDVLTTKDTAALQNIDETMNVILDDGNTCKSNMNTGNDVNKTLLNYLDESTNEENPTDDSQTKVTIDITDRESVELKKVSKSPEVDNYLLQPLGAIGSERKNSLVHFDSVGSFREVKSDSDRVNDGNILSLCWDFTLLLNGKTLHSDHHDHHKYHFYNSPKSSINADEIREQDKEFGKREQYATMHPSLSTKPLTDLLHVNYNPFEDNDMDGLINALTNNFDNCANNYERKKSTVIITEITGDTLDCEKIVKIEKSLDCTQICCYKNDTKITHDNVKEQFEKIPINVIVSIGEMSDKNCNNFRMLFNNKKMSKFRAISKPTEMKYSSLVEIMGSENFIDFIVNEECKKSLNKSSFLTFLNNMKTSIVVSNTMLDKHASESKDEENVQKNDIFISASEKTTEDIYYEKFIKDVQLTLNDDTVQMIKSSEQIHLDSNVIDDSMLPENTLNSYEELDNINRITWKESPFPLDDIPIPEFVPNSDITPKKVLTIDASTNTTYYDFNVAYVGGTSEPGYRIMNAYNRHINNGVPIMHVERPPLKLMLDKSSMTGDLFNGEGNPDLKTDDDNSNRIYELIELFPNIPRDCLTEVYEKLCMKDFDWTVEMLLDGVPDDISIKSSEKTNSNDSKIFNISHESNEQINITEEFMQDVNYCSEENTDHVTFTDYPNHQQQSLLYHENQVEHYEIAIDKERSNEMDYNDIKKRDIIDDVSIQSAVSESPQELSDNTKNPELEETIELNLGYEFIRTLENQFGHPDFQIPDGFQPVISIKKSIAENLYALWIESMYQQLNERHEQLDRMIMKDAEFAKSLERELEITEAQGSSNGHAEDLIPNLEEIMDMELALATYKNDVKSVVSKEIPDNMAARLSRQMLYESLPDIDPEAFNQILVAHNGNFKETFDIIQLNTGRSITPWETIKSTCSKLPEQKKVDNIHGHADSIGAKRISPIIVVQTDNKCGGNKSPHKNALKKASSLRKEEQRHLSLKIDNVNKAAEAYRRGYPQVAAYYSQVARLHSKNIEAVRNEAADALVNEQIYGHNENTLDLHYLLVTEALQALDKFLDYHMDKLTKNSRKKSSTVYIITGRGARSNNGTSKIKPAVSKRLSTRNIRFIEENPGCLKVSLNRKNGLTD